MGRMMSGLRFDSLADMPEGMRRLAGAAIGKEVAKPKAVTVAGQKYHNEKTEVNGIRFDSKKEASRYADLMQQLQLGAIQDLRLQEEFTLQEAYTTPDGKRVRAIRYRADFTYTVVRDGTPERVIEDTKGIRTDVYRIKKKMMAAKGYAIREV